VTSALDFRGWSVGGGWRYLAQRIDGTGIPGTWLETELPLTDVQITDVLSGPPQLSAKISPVVARELKPDGTPLLDEWGTVIHAEADGSIRGSFILVGSSFSGQTWSLDAVGFTGYPKGMAYDGQISFIQADPLDVVRHIWDSIQATQNSNLNLIVDPVTKTNIKIGTDPTSATSGTGEKPFTLDWWTTHDLGSVIDQLAASTPFDYRERHVWNSTRTDVRHFLDFGFPALGFRRTDLRFVLGENIQTLPEPHRDGEDFANHVRLLGAGEGSEMTLAEARRTDGRLRRMAVVDDKSITDRSVAATAARMELGRRNQLTHLTEVAVRNRPEAPFGSFGVGDEIRIQGSLDWMPLDLWCRVVRITISPDQPDLMSMSIVRTDWAEGSEAIVGTFTPPPPPPPVDPWGTPKFQENFTTDAVLGQFTTKYPNWGTYDSTTPNDTSGQGVYDTGRVVSVSGGILDKYLHTEAGYPRVAALVVPIAGNGTDPWTGQTYGKYEVRLRVAAGINGYKIAWLHWPANDDWINGEIDWPEATNLSTGTRPRPASKQKGNYLSIYEGDTEFAGTPVADGQWHTATTEWRPTSLRFYWDGALVTEITDADFVPSVPMRWVLQTETEIGGTTSPTSSGHLSLDYVRYWEYTGQ
jgi:hypothetical protein